MEHESSRNRPEVQPQNATFAREELAYRRSRLAAIMERPIATPAGTVPVKTEATNEMRRDSAMVGAVGPDL